MSSSNSGEKRYDQSFTYSWHPPEQPVPDDNNQTYLYGDIPEPGAYQAMSGQDNTAILGHDEIQANLYSDTAIVNWERQPIPSQDQAHVIPGDSNWPYPQQHQMQSYGRDTIVPETSPMWQHQQRIPQQTQHHSSGNMMPVVWQHSSGQTVPRYQEMYQHSGNELQQVSLFCSVLSSWN